MTRQNFFLSKIIQICQRIVVWVSVVIFCGAPNMAAYAEDTALPKRIVVFPIWAEEILLELVDIDHLIWVGHPYLEDAEMYWPTMKDTKSICGTIWQECDELEILSLSPDLIIWPYELSTDYDTIFPNLSEAQIPVVFIKKPKTISEIMDTVITLGNITGEHQKAIDLRNWLQLEVEKLGILKNKIPEGYRLTVLLDYEWQDGFQMIADMTGLINLLEGCENYVEVSTDLISELDPDLIVQINVYFDADGLYMPLQASGENDHCVVFIHFYPSQYIIRDCYIIMRKAYPFLFSQQE